MTEGQRTTANHTLEVADRLPLSDNPPKKQSEKFDIAGFRRPGLPGCHYIFVVITAIPEPENDPDDPWATYFYPGQIVICDTDAEGGSPREVAWGGKPGKHNCTVKKFTDLEKAILCAEAVRNDEMSGE